MRNRLARTVGATQVLKPDQHGVGAFELAVEMHLVTAEPLQLVAIEGLAEDLLAEQRPVASSFFRVTKQGRISRSRNRRMRSASAVAGSSSSNPSGSRASTSSHDSRISSRSAASATS